MPAEVARLRELASSITFSDGRGTNPANTTKVNLQSALDDPKNTESTQIVTNAFERSREFRDFAFPRRIIPPRLLRYDAGMKYGMHSDSTFMTAPGGLLRSDVSATVFLSDPISYEGGELMIYVGSRSVVAKGTPGDVVLYPSTTLHEVKPVRSGQRLVSITFIESVVPDQQKRQLLYELNEVAALEGLKMKWENMIRLEAVRGNLLRMWSD